LVSGTGLAIPTPGFREVRLKRLIRTGDSIPNYLAGSSFTYFSDAPTIGTGRALFRGKMSTTGGAPDSLWFHNYGSDSLTAGIVNGSAPRGAPPGATIETISQNFEYVAYGPNANVAAQTYLYGGGVTSSNSAVIVSPDYPLAGSIIQVRGGDSAGISDWKLKWYNQSSIVNANNAISVACDFLGTGVTGANGRGIWTTHGYGHLLARQGSGNDSVPGYPSDYFTGFMDFSNAAMNDAGITAFVGATYNNTTAKNSRFFVVRGQGVNTSVVNQSMVPPGFPSSSYKFSCEWLSVRMTTGLNPWVIFSDRPKSSNGLYSYCFWRWRAGVLTKMLYPGDSSNSPSGLNICLVRQNCGWKLAA
jgi:hypothetical protein